MSLMNSNYSYKHKICASKFSDNFINKFINIQYTDSDNTRVKKENKHININDFSYEVCNKKDKNVKSNNKNKFKNSKTISKSNSQKRLNKSNSSTIKSKIVLDNRNIKTIKRREKPKPITDKLSLIENKQKILRAREVCDPCHDLEILRKEFYTQIIHRKKKTNSSFNNITNKIDNNENCGNLNVDVSSIGRNISHLPHKFALDQLHPTNAISIEIKPIILDNRLDELCKKIPIVLKNLVKETKSDEDSIKRVIIKNRYKNFLENLNK